MAFTEADLLNRSLEELLQLVSDPAVQKEAKAYLYNLQPEAFHKLISDPDTRTKVESVWNAQPEAAGGVVETEPTAEETAEAERLAAEAEATRVADEAAAAEQARKDTEEAARLAAEAKAAEKKKVVVEYQVTDDDGKPLGNPTHLEADSWEEMVEKQKNAHINVTKAYHRAKNRKVTPKVEEPPAPQLTDEELSALIEDIRKGDDPKKAVTALRKVTGSENAEAERKTLREERAALEAQAISYEFMRRHITDFNPCEANSKLLGQYILDNNLEWTVDNLEEAFDQKRSELAPAVSAPAPVAANPAPAPAPVAAAPAPVPETPAVPTVAPAPTEPPAALAAAAAASAPPAIEAVPAPNPPAPAAPRKVPSSGVVPGTMAGVPRITAPRWTVTKEEIRKMPPAQLKLLMRDPVKRAEIERVANAR